MKFKTLSEANAAIETIEENLAARDEQIAKLTADVAAATSLAEFSEQTVATQVEQINTLNADLATATADIAARTGQLAEMQTNLGTAEARASLAEQNLARLEQLAGVRGIDSNLAIHGQAPTAKTITRSDFDSLAVDKQNEFMRSGGKITG